MRIVEICVKMKLNLTTRWPLITIVTKCYMLILLLLVCVMDSHRRWMTRVRSRDSVRIGNDESAPETNRDEVKKKDMEYHEQLKTQPKEFIILAEETCGLLY